ncbi:MAG: 50S ribosomal protein L22 [Acidimicrobiales bacterium]
MSPTTLQGTGPVTRAERRRARHPNKTNERPGTRAQQRYVRMSATKARVVLDLVRGKTIGEADEILAFTEREAAAVIRKVLDSAIANAEHNDEIPADELFISACYADEGPTLKRWRPRARGRATRIRKRTCHITVIVSRLPEDQLARRRAAETAAREARSGQGARAQGAAQDSSEARRRRVEKSRQAKAEAAEAAAAAEAEEHDDVTADDADIDTVEAAAEAQSTEDEVEAPAAGEADVETEQVAELDEPADAEDADEADTEAEEKDK